MEEFDTLDIIKILVASNELSLRELITHLQSFLIKNKANWMEQNFNLMYQTSFESDSFLELQKYCTDLMSKDPNKIFKSLDFSTVPGKLLVSLIQNDNLQMGEVEVWNHVLNWGLAQNPEISSDPSNYSKDDFNALKNTLQQCIPFIKFYNMTSKEFFYKVMPYKEILPEELYMDLLKTFMDPDSKPKRPLMITKKINDQVLIKICLCQLIFTYKLFTPFYFIKNNIDNKKSDKVLLRLLNYLNFFFDSFDLNINLFDKEK